MLNNTYLQFVIEIDFNGSNALPDLIDGYQHLLKFQQEDLPAENLGSIGMAS